MLIWINNIPWETFILYINFFLCSWYPPLHLGAELVYIARKVSNILCMLSKYLINSIQFSCSVMSDSLRPHGLQHTRLAYHQLLAYSNSCPLCWWCHPTISSSVISFSFHPQSFPAPGSLKRVSSSHKVAKVLEFQVQHQSFQWLFRADFLSDWQIRSSCSPRDSQESSPTPQFKSINSLVLSFLYSPSLTSIHDDWKNHSVD